MHHISHGNDMMGVNYLFIIVSIVAKKEKEAKKEASPATSSAAAMDTTADKRITVIS